MAKAAQPSATTAKLIVGYTTRRIEDFAAYKPADFPCTDGRLKDPAKIESHKLEKEQAWDKSAERSPYIGTFNSVMIVDPQQKAAKKFDYRPPGGERASIAMAVRAWLNKHYPNAWSTEFCARHREPSKAILIGFNMRLFVKMLALECSLPENNAPLPFGFWYGETDHRDISEAVMPAECAHLGWPAVLKRRGIAVEGWTEPGVDAHLDSLLATKLAVQLNLFSPAQLSDMAF